MKNIYSIYLNKVVQQVLKWSYLTLALNIIFYSNFSYAQANNVGQVIINLNNNMPAVIDFLSGFSVVVGVALVFAGMFKLKHLADMRNMMSGQMDVTKAIGLITFGGIFIWSPYVLEALTYTIFGSDIGGLQTSYPVATNTQELLPYFRAFVGILQVIGLISFIRGLFVLANMSKGQNQPGSFAKGVTHILAGVFLVNVTAFLGFLEPTLGVSFSFS